MSSFPPPPPPGGQPPPPPPPPPPPGGGGPGGGAFSGGGGFGGQQPYGQPQYGAPMGAPSLTDPQGRPLAEWWKRLVALIIDLVILGIVQLILMRVVGFIAGWFLGVVIQAV